MTEALRSLAGQELESIALEAVGPGAFTLNVAAGGAENSIRLDRQGARLASVGNLTSPMQDKHYYMACLDLKSRSCLVVGGGRVALEKIHGLLDCGARVTVVALDVSPKSRRAGRARPVATGPPTSTAGFSSSPRPRQRR